MNADEMSDDLGSTKSSGSSSIPTSLPKKGEKKPKVVSGKKILSRSIED